MAAMTPPLRRVRWEVSRLTRVLLLNLGWGATLGVLGLACATGFWASGQHLRTQAREMRQQLEERSRQPRPAPKRPDPSRALNAFYTELPSPEHIPQIVADLLALAERQHVEPQSAQYRTYVDSNGNYLRYRIVLPVKGNAAAVQSFLLAALHEHRTLALESAAFKRDKIESHDVEVRIQLALLTRIPASAQTTLAMTAGGTP